MQSSVLLDRAGRRRSPAALPGYHQGRPPRNKGLRYPPQGPGSRGPAARTSMASEVGRDRSGRDAEQAIAGLATGRFTTPDEVATLVGLLASPKTANVTGSNYVIDGGLIKTM